MKKEVIKQKLEKIFLSEFDELDVITGNEKIGNVAEWDSLGHIRLLAAIENEFRIRTPLDKYVTLESFSKIFNYLEKNSNFLKL